MTRLGIGIQLYTVREETSKDFRGTLRKIAALGYEGVEFAGYGDVPAEEMKALLQELNLQVIGSHVGWDKLANDVDSQIDYLKTIGGTYFIVPHVAAEYRKDAEDWKRNFELFNTVGEKVQAAGLKFAYHNHDFEFHVQVDGQYAFDALFQAVPSADVEMDLGWMQFAGLNTEEYIRTYTGRLPLVHVKDYVKSAEGKIKTVELGNGEIPLEKTIQWVEQAGTKWLIVEQDHCDKNSLECVATSIEWLKANYLVSN